MGSTWSLRSGHHLEISRRFHFNIPWNANIEIWFWRMVFFIGGIPILSMMIDTHHWLDGWCWWARGWKATCRSMTQSKNRQVCVGYSWNILAIMWHILLQRVWWWMGLGMALASYGSKDFGCLLPCSKLVSLQWRIPSSQIRLIPLHFMGYWSATS